MSVIIRLQNLPWSANALDIRQFFQGLSIPEGGVHIVGGEQGDAFIAFSTDEDARQAFSRNNGKIKEVQITLMLSSRTEMQKVIEAARAQSYAAFMQPSSTPNVMPLPAAVPNLLPAALSSESKKDNKDRSIDGKSDSKRDKKRSRSKSRDRKDRRDRRRDRDHRSRSRSRERRERRRRERSRSRDRNRSRSKDRKSRDRRRSDDNTNSVKKPPEVWAINAESIVPQPPSLLSNLVSTLEEARRNLGALATPNNLARNLQGSNFNNRSRDGWSQPDNQNNFGRPDNSRQIGNQPFQNNRFQPRNFPRSNDQFIPNNDGERETLPDCCVKLQPFYGGYGEIRRFFQGTFISNTGIKFINDDFGHRTGIVFIQFGHPQGKNEALNKSGDTLNGVQVEVAHIDDEEFDEAIDRYLPDNYQNDDNSRLGSKFRNITKYFNTNNGKNEDLKVYSCLIIDDLPTYVKEQDILKMFSPRPLISLILTMKPRGGHVAYVKFGSSDEAKKAFEEKSNHVVEGKSVTVKPCSDQEFEAVNKQNNGDLDDNSNNEIETDCINITRLPLQTNNIEVTDFFSDIGVRPVKIHLMNNRLGFTGQAFCEFKTVEDATQALKKDGVSFGPNQVSVQGIPREEMENILHKSQQSNVTVHHPIMPRGLMMNQNRPFFPRNNFDGGRGGGPRYMGRGPRPRFMNCVPLEDALPGCTVFMDNVPYKAGTNEILDFFDGYDITNNVSRRFNPNNTPSAEARVLFNSVDEAFRAVQEKNGQKIWERPIYLKQV